MEFDVQGLSIQLGGGAGGAMLLTFVVGKTWEIAPRFLPLTALLTGWFLGIVVGMFVAGGFPVDAEEWFMTVVLGLAAGLSAVGAWRAADKTVNG